MFECNERRKSTHSENAFAIQTVIVENCEEIRLDMMWKRTSAI